MVHLYYPLGKSGIPNKGKKGLCLLLAATYGGPVKSNNDFDMSDDLMLSRA
jgi:hypothetical protein